MTDRDSFTSSAKPALKVLQLTDTHLFADNSQKLMGVDTHETLQEVVALFLQSGQKPDLVVLTGDLSQDETIESYTRLAEIISQIGVPTHYLPGNHDQDNLVMAKAFASYAQIFRSSQNIRMKSWQIILLNSSQKQKVGGYLSFDELDRLDRCLTVFPNQHAMVCLHHHVLPVESDWMDAIALENQEEFLKIIDRHDQVKAVVSGHAHQEFAAKRRGVAFMTTPSTCVQFAKSEKLTVDDKLPGYRMLELYEDGSMNTEVFRLSDYVLSYDRQSAGY